MSGHLLGKSCSLGKPYVLFVLCLFILHHFKKCGVLCYTLRSKICVRVSVRPSALRFHSLPGAIFKKMFFKHGIRVDFLEGVSWDCRWVNKCGVMALY